MVRVAAIDCGSNSTRLLISNVENGRLENLLKQHEVTKLSENLIKTNKIGDDSKRRFYKVLRKYLKIIENNNVEEVYCIGTASLRNSRNSDEIIADVKSKFNLDLKQSGMATHVAEIIFSLKAEKRVLVSSFSPRRLDEFINVTKGKILSSGTFRENAIAKFLPKKARSLKVQALQSPHTWRGVQIHSKKLREFFFVSIAQ